MGFPAVTLTAIGTATAMLPLLRQLQYPRDVFLAATAFSAVLLLAVRLNGSKVVALVVVLATLLHAQWGIAQFIAQNDLGLQYVGETQLDTHAPGIAKFTAPQKKLIRAYGPYAHANSFGGSMMLSLALLAGSAMPTLKPRPNHRQPGRPVFVILSAVLLLAVVLSFSRAAYLAAGFTVLWLWLRLYAVNIRFGWRYLGLVSTLVATLLPLMAMRAVDAEDAAVRERWTGVSWAVGLIAENGWREGVGLGNYVSSLNDYLNNHSIEHKPWQVDYVHNVPLVLITELGGKVVGLAAALLLLLVYTQAKWWYVAAVSPLLLLDHYLITQAAPLSLLLAAGILLYHR